MAKDKGYKPSRQAFEAIKSFSKTSLSIMFLLAFVDHLLIWVPAIIGISLFNLQMHFIGIIVCIFALIISARGMRGLECLVHDASHENWVRGKRGLNDFLANIICAWPLISTVQDYRGSHLNHHLELGTELDPDYIRHKKLGILDLDRSNGAVFFSQITRRFIPYSVSWWRAIGTTTRSTWRFFFWHLIFLVLATCIYRDPYATITVWIVGFMVPFIVFLPIIRFVGESGEHDYNYTGSIAVSTYSNIGVVHKLLFHPHNDGFHTIHHLFPQIPHHNLHIVDARLADIDGDKWKQAVRKRFGLFSSPPRTKG